MDQRDRLYSCDDHLDLWNLPPTLWTDRLPQALRQRGPRVVEEGEQRWWRCDGATIGPSTGPRLAQYSAIGRAGIADDGYRASTPSLRLVDMDRDGIWASVIYARQSSGCRSPIVCCGRSACARTTTGRPSSTPTRRHVSRRSPGFRCTNRRRPSP